jgi:hypothetical protein
MILLATHDREVAASHQSTIIPKPAHLLIGFGAFNAPLPTILSGWKAAIPMIDCCNKGSHRNSARSRCRPVVPP